MLDKTITYGDLVIAILTISVVVLVAVLVNFIKNLNKLTKEVTELVENSSEDITETIGNIRGISDMAKGTADSISNFSLLDKSKGFIEKLKNVVDIGDFIKSLFKKKKSDDCDDCDECTDCADEDIEVEEVVVVEEEKNDN